MRYLFRVGWIGLAVVVGLGVLLVTSDDFLESFDLHRPATLFPIVGRGIQTLRSQAGRRVSDLINAATGAFRERTRHEIPG
jgi:hypothetical protein